MDIAFALKTLNYLLLAGVSSFVYVLSKKYKFPYTLFLVFVGIVLAVLSYLFEPLHIITQVQLSPEILFFVFLPTLLFEAAYNIKLSYLINLARPILLLAIFGLLVSAFFIGATLYWVLGLLGFEVSFLATLLFGAIISATDPVAVIALFKEYAAPKRLTILFEGESLFNDGTAVALFLVVLGLIEAGITSFNGAILLEGILIFASMILLGGLLGLVLGVVFSKLVYVLKDNKAQITIFLLAAHLSFVLAEILNEHFVHISAIITTVVVAIIMGNYARYKLSPEIDNYINNFWDYFAFLANSFVFILLGFLILKLDFLTTELIVASVIAILIVVIARALSVYVSLIFVSKDTSYEIPSSWKVLLSWGSLRGALAITMVLMIPEDLQMSIPGLDVHLREFVMALVVLSIYFTLFIKGLSMSKFMEWLHITRFGRFEKMSYLEAKTLAYKDIKDKIKQKLKQSKSQDDSQSIEKIEAKCKQIEQTLADFLSGNQEVLFKTLLYHAIGVEKAVLEKLYSLKRISEKAYKKFTDKLENQEFMLEAGHKDVKSFDEITNKDLADHIIAFFEKIFKNKSEKFSSYDKYTYYTALVETAHAVLESLNKIADTVPQIKNTKAYKKILQRYSEYEENAIKKLNSLNEQEKQMDKIKHKELQESLLVFEQKELETLTKTKLINEKIKKIIDEEIKTDLDEVL